MLVSDLFIVHIVCYLVLMDGNGIPPVVFSLILFTFNLSLSTNRPYDDPWVISAQILTIGAVLLSWVWWFTFLVNLAAMALFQILWCVHMRSGPLYSHVAVTSATSAGCLALGIYVLVAWGKKTYCYT